MILIYLVVLLVMSLATYRVYGIDKMRAKKEKWRIPERVLLGLGVLGGATGALVAMKRLRHKTRHISFYIVNILAIVLHIALLVYIFLNSGIV